MGADKAITAKGFAADSLKHHLQTLILLVYYKVFVGVTINPQYSRA